MEDFKSLEASFGLLKPSVLYGAFCFSSSSEAHCSSDALQNQNIFQHNSEDCELDRLELWIPLQKNWHRSIGANLSMYKNLHIGHDELPWSRSLDPNRRVALSNHCTEICNIKSPWVKLQATQCVVWLGGLCDGVIR